MSTYFFDNNISWRIVAALRHLVDPQEVTLIALRDRFGVDALDTDWIPTAGKEGWIIISRDHKQRRRHAERQALMKAQARVLYIRQSDTRGDLYTDAARIIRNWPKISEWGKIAEPGSLVKLDASDRIVPLES